MSISAVVEKDTIRLPVHVPDGTRVEITLLDENMPAKPGSHAWMLDYAGVVDDLPADLASEHDHYLYGTPKRGGAA